MTTQGISQALELSSLPPGTQIGSWCVRELRGLGTYGAVYRAERVGAQGSDSFALKLARHPLDPRFEREAELLSRLSHPNVPRLQDRGLWAHPSGPIPFIVMDWVDGSSLYSWGHSRTLTSRQVLRVLAQAAHALAATHAAHGLHRDFKGHNLLVRSGDFHLALIDFGSASFLGAPPLTDEVLPPGTPPYRSPEAVLFQWRFWQQRGVHYTPGPADDVYALGVTAYRLVTGVYPPAQVKLKAAPGEAPLPTPAQVPAEHLVTISPRLAKLIRQMLSKKPSSRGSAAQLARALEQAAESAGPEADQPITLRPRPASVPQAQPPSLSLSSHRQGMGLAAAAGLAASLLLQGAWFLWRQPSHGRGDSPPGLARDGTEADAGTSGLAKDALPSNDSTPNPEAGTTRIGLDVPKKPLPGQAKPPCMKREVELNGGCWGLLRDALPPCEGRNYEWRGACYYPVLAPVRPETSEKP
ncbi:serine/threonine-protein kinase [Stigmatella aurantiaca]|uniref:Protein kinase n=1 Tax=Stigmatella aurantiaca (strain DW4/3-1) TaxID=378806 RepID=Q09D52_STIAD|nr:serine/threonine-protein kinase [Stigmatella aurantiaca]ADO67858.1 Serine/threonine protein kinase [Stigmatella aurantiaca DW4/3-1]EAU69642.1 protein kinase [Stigmatella aurantiaca DW4/3-1]